MRASTVTIKSEQDIEKLRISGRLAAQVLEMISDYIQPGVSTEYLDDICNDYIVNKAHTAHKITAIPFLIT